MLHVGPYTTMHRHNSRRSAGGGCRCPCLIDGISGPLCELRTEQVCINQCSGHGECRMGFCLCHEGYYGHDCARKRAGFPDYPGACPALSVPRVPMVPPAG